MPVDRVVAQVGLAPDEPFDEWRIAEIAHLIPALVPVDGLGLLGPKPFGVIDRMPVELPILLDAHRLRLLGRRLSPRGAPRSGAPAAHYSATHARSTGAYSVPCGPCSRPLPPPRTFER